MNAGLSACTLGASELAARLPRSMLALWGGAVAAFAAALVLAVRDLRIRASWDCWEGCFLTAATPLFVLALAIAAILASVLYLAVAGEHEKQTRATPMAHLATAPVAAVAATALLAAWLGVDGGLSGGGLLLFAAVTFASLAAGLLFGAAGLLILIFGRRDRWAGLRLALPPLALAGTVQAWRTLPLPWAVVAMAAVAVAGAALFPLTLRAPAVPLRQQGPPPP